MSAYWKDKAALVTGGTSGLGRVIATALAAAGCKLAVIGSKPETAEATAGEMQAAGFDVLGVAADITRQEDVDRAVSQVIKHYGRLDILVNAAGRSMRGRALDTTPEQFRNLMELNLIGTIRCTSAAAPHLLKAMGHVVNIGSLASKSASRWTGAYPATKHAVAAYTQQLRLELGPEGLHVLLVCPGPVKREGPRRYALEGAEGLPEDALGPGAGVKVKGIPPEKIARLIMRACEKRKPELVIPATARLLFAVQQLLPSLGDWLVVKMT